MLPSSAQAQAGYFYLDRAQLSGAPDDGYMVWRPYMHEETRFYGTAALGYTQSPLRASTVSDDPTVVEAMDNPVQGQLILYGILGAQISNRVGVNLAIPLTLYKFAGDDPQVYGVGEGGIEDNPVAFHDMRFDARVKLYESDNRKLRLGLGGALFAPSGNSAAFASDDGLSGYLFGSGEVDLGQFLIAGNLGPHFKPDRSIGGDPNVANLYTGSELRWAFGAYLPLRDGKIRIGAELWGSTGIVSDPNGDSTFFKGDNTDLEWLAQGRMTLDKKQRVWAGAGFGTRLATGYGAPDFRILASIGTYITLKDEEPKSPAERIKVIPDADDYEPDRDGDGYPDSVDKCPDIKEDGKEPAPTDGCPATADRDGDGIPDTEDQCPDNPEDKDGVQDQDGCPEEDPDNDKVPDAEDKCPEVAGPVNKNQPDKNGCPTKIRLDEGTGEVQILQPIEFEFGKAVIKADSFPILDEVLTLMQSQPSMRIGVYGHTDNRGGQALNMRLSKDRAAACKTYLIQKGINANRLESEGFGPTKPIADNATDDGRAKNRRVEFKVLPAK
ncbi:MAG TPA: OmpA family protein [Polyangiaceae bacterium]|nr:OmpA family protein [Polyangiaceae bacterium]